MKAHHEAELPGTVYNVEKNPEQLIISNGDEQINEIRIKKELTFDFDKPKKDESFNKANVPQEQIRALDDILIKNFEVDFEEEAPDVRMIGGIRGIKALRVQREYIPDVEKEFNPK